MQKGGWTPLHSASTAGHVDVVKVLLEANCNVNAQDKTGQTALHLASPKSHVDVVELLLGRCNVSTLDKNERSAVHMAIMEPMWPSSLGAEKMVVLRALAAHGAKWDSKCDEMIDNGEAIPEARALAVCFGLWEREYAMKLPLTEIPHEVVQGGVSDTEFYVRERQQSRELINRVKVCLVGPSGWGKTSLAQSVTTASSSLRHQKDRTIGIDHWTKRIEVPVPGENKVIVYEVTFWDFGGQDAYQVVHSLFFSYRTLYLVCVDLQSYAATLAQAKLLSFNKDQMGRLVDDFIDTKIFKWIRVVLARQPDAEFAFVFTKADVLQRNSARVEKIRSDLEDRLRRYCEESIVAIGRLYAAESAGGSGSGEGLCDVTGLRFTPVRDGLDVHEHGALQDSLRRLSEPKCAVVSCKDGEGVESARRIDQVIAESNRAFPMPDLYSQVLDYVREKRVDSFEENVHELNLAVELRIAKISFNRCECEAILRVLHHLGVILWYDDLVIEGLSDTVILNPMRLIDLIRQIVNHNNLSERIAHLDLVRLPFWRDLGDELMLMVKRLLYEFRIVCPSRGEMELDSDLIVPAFWQTKTEAAWLFCEQPLSLEESISVQKHEGQVIRKVTSTPGDHKEAIRVRWEYHFNMLPESIFDQVVIASQSVFLDRHVGPDWILYEKKNRFACRLMVTRDLKACMRVVRLEAVAVDAYDKDLWSCFESLWESLETVLGRFRGLVFTRQAYDEKEKSRRLKDVIAEWQKQRRRTGCVWLPPDMELYGQVLACRPTGPMPDDRVGGKRGRPWP